MDISPFLRLAGDYTCKSVVASGKPLKSQVSIPRRKLLDYEVYIVDRGQGYICTDETSFSIKEGDLVLVPPLLSHWHCFSEVFLYWAHVDLVYTSVRNKTFVVPSGTKLSTKEESFAQPILTELFDKTQVLVVSTHGQKATVVNIFKKLISLDIQDGVKKEIKTSKLILDLMDIFIEGNQVISVSKSLKNKLLKTKNYLEGHLYHSINVESMAKQSGLAFHYFIHQFKKSFGVSPYAYHLKCRLDAAANTLLEGDLNVSEVSDAYGFETIYHFSRAFKKQFGISPKKYIKENITGSNDI